MNTHTYKKSNIVNIVAILLFVTICIIVICKLYFNPLLWYDESGQLWLALGLNHISPPYSAPQGFLSALTENRLYNLDPGGFTALLYIWAKISIHYLWLRILPLLFYVLFLFYVYKLAYHYSHHILLSVVSMCVLFVFPHPWLAVELRAYSMEMCGVVATCYFLVKHQGKLCSYKNLVMLCILLCFFCTSRYEFLLFAFAVSLRILYLILRQDVDHWIIKSIKSLLYGVPLCAWVIAIYFYETQYYNADLSVPDYVRSLFSDRSLLFSSLAILYYIQLGIFVYHLYRKNTLSEFSIIGLSFVTIEYLCSICDKYPWDDQRSIGIAVILPMMTIIELNKMIKQIDKEKIIHIYSLSVVSVCCLLGLFLWENKYNECLRDRYGCLIEYQKLRTSTEVNISEVYFSGYLIPDIRYLYEYGILRDCCTQDGYPQNFHFNPNWCAVDTNYNYIFDRHFWPPQGYQKYNGYDYLFEKIKDE